MSTVFATDEEAIAACPRDLPIRAVTGTAIVWFLPYRRTGEGMIEIPDSAQPQSVEALIIHDASEHGLDPGVMVGVSRNDGEYFTFRGHKLCRVKGSSLIVVNTEFSPEIE
jgi:hypothetical protein